MRQRLGKKFWITLVIFSLMGQVAWVVENMYFNVFIYKMFHASAGSISLMVAASAVAATLTTWLIGALSDKLGRRKLFICGGYVLWGISILTFALIRIEVLTPIAGSAAAAASLGVTLVILMDCVMTFFGSTANDACFNAWLTDVGDETNRGRIEGINSMMPLVAILVVFGGFMAFDLDRTQSWVTIYLVIGIAVLVIGVLGFFLIEDHVTPSEETKHYLTNVVYSFRISVMKENPLLYAVIGAFALFGISIQIFMPYLILYYEQTLGMTNYVLIMAPAIIIAAVITAFYGKMYDLLGFRTAVIPTVIMLMLGYVLLFFSRLTGFVFLGSLFMMTGYLTGMAMFGAMIRDHIPENKAGQFQGLRIFGQVLVPGVIGPAIGAAVLRNAQQITNSDGTISFLPNRNIYLAAFVAAAVLCVILYFVFRLMRMGHYELTTEAGECGWQEYPRPQMRRDSFYSLNGSWQLNRQEICVPFAPQSVLSGYGHHAPEHLVYQKFFSLPKDFAKDRVLLHFGAVDQVAEVILNGQKYGKHEGGYLPFVLDVTEAVKRQGENHLIVKAVDHLSELYPYGKQRKKRGGMWYTPVSGIWQSVWMESVPEQYIQKIKITPDLKGIELEIEVSDRKEEKAEPKTKKADQKSECADQNTECADQKSELVYQVSVDLGMETCLMQLHGRKVRIDLSQIRLKDGSYFVPELWTPEHPKLYQMEIRMMAGSGVQSAEQQVGDVIHTYFALRTVTIEERSGNNRICLNGEPIFLHGVLDQGYYCDGIYLPANEKEYERDILRMKELGFNILRKHIKVEPECFYYACDRLGMLVLQDMVNNGHYSFIHDTALPTLGMRDVKDTRHHGSRRRREMFEKHTEQTIEHLYNHPCIVGYTIFNEGWGQFDSDRMYERVKAQDATRFVDTTSGWFHQTESDVDSPHIYFKNMKLHTKTRPMLVSECGGYAYSITGHIYSRFNSYGYGNCISKKQVTDSMETMYREMILPAISRGLCGCIYTQLSDVEDEVNGIYTYDRKICKVEKERIRQISRELQERMQS